MIKKLLIANRGEIACRIARTCRGLGIAVATVHSAADCDSLHVKEIGESIAIGGAPASQSYLNIEAILKAARQAGADAVHPGIGFLSEDPNFAEAVEAAGMIFIGPRPETMRRFSDKWAAKHEAREANVPVIGGSEGSSTDSTMIDKLIRETMRLPVVLKAAAGGGGRGVRIVRQLEGLVENIESAMREAQSSFGRPDLIVEEFIENARHLEVQVVGDGEGKAIHLFERECSLQRRFQKIIEEAPAANLPPTLRDRILSDAVNLASRVGYRGLGTMEFLVAGDRHYFLECNPRLQVEHTVTEEVTGLDLVAIQLNIAVSGRLPLPQEAVVVRGHAVQARVYAEDAAAGFIPSTGKLQLVDFPKNLRVETGVETGSVISPYYDSMIAKLVAHGADRAQALDRLSAAVEKTVVFGVETNLFFLTQLLNHPVVRAGTADNRFIDGETSLVSPPPPPGKDTVAIAAALLLHRWTEVAAQTNVGLWSGADELLGWKFENGADSAPSVPMFSLAAADGEIWPIGLGRKTMDGQLLFIGGEVLEIRLRGFMSHHCQVELDGRVLSVEFHLEDMAALLQSTFGKHELTVVPFLSLAETSASKNGLLRAPMMGTIAKVNVKAGDIVASGDVLIVQESMKMELYIETLIAGVVSAVNCAQGDMVERHQILVDVAPAQP